MIKISETLSVQFTITPHRVGVIRGLDKTGADYDFWIWARLNAPAIQNYFRARKCLAWQSISPTEIISLKIKLNPEGTGLDQLLDRKTEPPLENSSSPEGSDHPG